MTPPLPPARIKRAAELKRLGYSYADIGRIMDLNPDRLKRLLKPDAARPVPCGRCGGELPMPNARTRYARPILCVTCLAACPTPCFADRLATHRLAAGYTLRGLSEKTGIDGSALRDMEHGHSEPSWRQLVALVKAVGMDLLTVPPVGAGEAVRTDTMWRVADEE